MHPEKIAWDDIPNNKFVKNKDDSKGKLIECSLCCIAIRVRTGYGFTEWGNHWSPNKHYQIIKEKQSTRYMSKLTCYFDTARFNN